MLKIVLYCKSYSGDLNRCIELSKSINQYNKDNIPFYISVPKNEINLFKNKIPYYDEIIEDESVSNLNDGWVGQQYVKALFYKLGISKFYINLDSDCYFFKNFYIKDFVGANNIPYLVMHYRETFYEFVDKFDPRSIREVHEKRYDNIKNYFGRKGKTYHYGISPMVWDTEVWEQIDKDHNIDKLFKIYPNELKWYGEAMLYYKKPFMPTGPYFKEFHYDGQYWLYKDLGYTEEHFKKQYMGIVLQSNWNAPLKYD
jgi:hypothetical protein